LASKLTFFCGDIEEFIDRYYNTVLLFGEKSSNSPARLFATDRLRITVSHLPLEKDILEVLGTALLTVLELILLSALWNCPRSSPYSIS